jgi:hypothetical protein
MRWSGLSILDAPKLERDRLSRNDAGDDQNLSLPRQNWPQLRRAERNVDLRLED